MDNQVAVSVIIDPINQTHLRGSVSVAGLTVEFSGSRNLLSGGCWFGSLCSLFLLGSTPFTFTFQNLLLVLLVPRSFSLSSVQH